MLLPVADLVWGILGLAAGVAAPVVVAIGLMIGCLYGAGGAWVALIGDGRHE